MESQCGEYKFKNKRFYLYSFYFYDLLDCITKFIVYLSEESKEESKEESEESKEESDESEKKIR